MSYMRTVSSAGMKHFYTYLARMKCICLRYARPTYSTVSCLQTYLSNEFYLHSFGMPEFRSEDVQRVNWIMNLLGSIQRLPVYLSDDMTSDLRTRSYASAMRRVMTRAINSPTVKTCDGHSNDWRDVHMNIEQSLCNLTIVRYPQL